MLTTEKKYIDALPKETDAQRIHATAIKEAVSSREAMELSIENLQAQLKSKQEAVKYLTSEVQVAMDIVYIRSDYDKATDVLHKAKRVFHRIIGEAF